MCVCMCDKHTMPGIVELRPRRRMEGPASALTAPSSALDEVAQAHQRHDGTSAVSTAHHMEGLATHYMKAVTLTLAFALQTMI